MECVAARSLTATMAILTHRDPTWRSRTKMSRNKQVSPVLQKHTLPPPSKPSLSSSSSSSCVQVISRSGSRCSSELDDEDYVKAGGSQHMFVQMQQTKSMEGQSKLADKLQEIRVGDCVLDLIVIGCGPAGLALAAESAKLGLKVGLVGPDLPFTNNYGVWEEEFIGLGLEKCIEHVWHNTIVYIDDNDPIRINHAYGRVSRHLLHEELLRRCVESGVSYLSSKVERVTEDAKGYSLVECEGNIVIPCRLATVASGSASGKLLEYEPGGPRFCLQTAYGVEVEVENSPYDPSAMVFMDYRDYTERKIQSSEEQYSTFMYAMPMSRTRVFFEETCLASKDGMPLDLLKKRLMSRLATMGVRILKTYEEEWSYIPIGGSLPKTGQKIFAFGAAASMVHPSTGYSLVRSLSEAPRCASAIAKSLRQSRSLDTVALGRYAEPISKEAWETLWPLERKRQRAFFLFGLSLIVQMDIEDTRTFFRTFFRSPSWFWWGFLGSSLSSTGLMLFGLCSFFMTPHDMRMAQVRHLFSDPTGATMLRTYLTF